MLSVTKTHVLSVEYNVCVRCMMYIYVYILSSCAWGKIKVKLTSLPRIFMHVVSI